MKKKQLRALNALEKWLLKEISGNDPLQESFKCIRQAIEGLPDEESVEVASELPAPKELGPDTHAIALFSDGGCRGNPGPGASAFVIQDYAGKVLGEGVEFEAFTTNNKMELLGPIRGLSELIQILPEAGRDPLLTKVVVVTDSKYVVDGMKTWVSGWKARGWKKADGKTPENLDLWQNLEELRTRFMDIDWKWVKGHGGHPQNEYCDKKANEAMDENIS